MLKDHRRQHLKAKFVETSRYMYMCMYGALRMCPSYAVCTVKGKKSQPSFGEIFLSVSVSRVVSTSRIEGRLRTFPHTKYHARGAIQSARRHTTIEKTKIGVVSEIIIGLGKKY